MPKVGKPLTLNDAKIDKIVAILDRGNFRYVVQQRLGISPRTFQSWVEKGKRDRLLRESGELDDSIYCRFIDRIEESEAKAHQRLLCDVIEAEDPKCKMWFLERRWNKLYSKNPNAVIDDETGETIKRDMIAQLADKLSQFIEED
jgi:hypothetical protein